jgi:hypothetical protein
MLSPGTTVGRVRTPKRGASEITSRARWFKYYAGFSSGFVEDALEQLNLDTGATLLDPWLGGGTTAEVATACGLQFRGYDLNPSMLFVAKARTFAKERAVTLANFIERTIGEYERKVASIERQPKNGTPDPLEQWLQPRTARAFRTLESVVAKLDQPCSPARPIWQRATEISAGTCVFYVALFRTLRHFLSHFQTSNPTWVKLSNGGPRVQISDGRILGRFLTEMAFLQDSLHTEQKPVSSGTEQHCLVGQASSTDLPLKSNSIDAILSSPPYCTRIDYVRATLPELAIVGFPSGERLRALRDDMMGTPTVSAAIDENDQRWGPACNHFLSRVEGHSSKASSTYYTKYFRQYFATAFVSLIELDRVLKHSGQCMLVVQDSYYKDVLNNLPLIFAEMAANVGWGLVRRLDFPVARTFAGIHPETRRYRQNFDAIESVLSFRKL